MTSMILAIDQGTTNTKALLVDRGGQPQARASVRMTISTPRSNWVEQDAEPIWQSVLEAVATCLQLAPGVAIAGVAISNRRETVVVWDRLTGKPLAPAIVWQCQRSSAICDQLHRARRESAPHGQVRRRHRPLDGRAWPHRHRHPVLEQYAEEHGVNVCTIMSMMSAYMLPSACEVDIAGVVSMYALQLASGRPSSLVDWNNHYSNDPDKCVFFHCCNWAKDFLPDIRVGTAPILGTVLGEANTVGALAGRTPAGPITFGRVSTDDTSGIIRAYVGEGKFTDDPLDTFGTRAVVQVPRLPELMRYICRNGFEHHAAMAGAHCAGAVTEGLGNYLGWEILNHG